MRRGVLTSLVVAISLIVPAAAAASVGPASFYKATGGSFVEAVHPGGLTISKSSPAYIVIGFTGSAADLEQYSASNTFPAVGIRNGNRTDCFLNARLVVVPSFVSDFTEGLNEYHGLLMTYTGHFRLGTPDTSQCRTARALGPILPTVSLSRSSAKLSVTCRIKYCNGKFAAFNPPSTCRGPVRLLPGVFGCSPAFNGFFKVPGGLTDRLTIPLKGTSANVMRVVLVVNGKTVVSSTISALARTPRAPARPKTSSVSIGCGTGTVGSAGAASGQISPRGRGTVVVTFTGPSGTDPVMVTVGAGANGAWKASFTPSAAGPWTARAAFIGDRSRKGALSKTCPFTVAVP